ncbi:MAG TPA: ribosome maturation factor RimP [Firmicutes bacterium]|nr:ribosome maturation factor RimP [Bacillota bacterium]
MKGRQLQELIANIAEPIAASHGTLLVAVEVVTERGKKILRVVLDKPGGVTLDDCEAVSKELDSWLDREDPVDGSYYLEVCSPGLNRRLKSDREFRVFKGRRVEVQTFREVGGSKRFIGKLGDSTGNTIVITDQENGKEMIFDKAIVSSVRLKDDIEERQRK